MPRSYLITKTEYQLFDDALEDLKLLIRCECGSPEMEGVLRSILSKLQKIYPAPLASNFTPGGGDVA